jgi:ribosomal protein S18 acetylase RimI-like enzyme
MVEYYLNKATESSILTHILSCDDNFVQSLNERINVTEYGKKLYAEALRFEAWDVGKLVGMVAGYCNDTIKRTAYITSVSVLNDWQRKGIAVQLISQFIEHAEKFGMSCISLEVARGNEPAIRLYEKCGFVVNVNGDSSITMNLILKRGENAK